MGQQSVSVTYQKIMSDSDGVVPETQIEPDDTLNVSDIAAALFDNPPTTTDNEVSEADPGGATEEVVEELDTEPEPETQEAGDSPGVKKRIEKLIAQKHEAESEMVSLRKRVDELESKPDSKPEQPRPEARFQKATTHDQLQKLEQEAKAMDDWITVNPDGGTFMDAEGNEQVIDMEKAREIAGQVRKDLRDNIPLRREELVTRGKVIQQAQQMFPWMTDQTSAEHTEVASLLARNSRLSEFYDEFPQSPLMMGYVIEGIKAVQARGKKAQGAAKPPAVPTPSTRSTTQPKKESKSQNALLDRAMASGDRGAVADYLETIL